MILCIMIIVEGMARFPPALIYRRFILKLARWGLGIELDEKTLKKVTDRVIQLGDKKEQITLDDLPYIVADVLDLAEIEQKVKIINYNLSHAKGLKPVASVALKIEGKQYEATSHHPSTDYHRAPWTPDLWMTCEPTAPVGIK